VKPSAAQPPRASGQHSAHNQQDEVKIYYRFHPDSGAAVQVLHRLVYRGEAVATIISPDNTLRTIPTWMIDPLAARLDIHVPPRLSHECLADLRRILDVALSVLSDATTASAQSEGGDA
jgi:hypothetical protein